MFRHTINIDDHQYVVDLIKANDINIGRSYKKFVMLRKYSIINDLCIDSDIYFIDKDLFTADNISSVIFPCTSSKIEEFSYNFKKFNPDFFSEDILLDNGYLLYDSEGNEKDIPCDKLRVYHPQNKVDLDAVIYCDSWINDVHFHYAIKKIEKIPSNSVTEFRQSNAIFSEYVEIDVPSIEELFSKTTFFAENVNAVSVSFDPSLVINTDKQYCSMSLFTVPFTNENGVKTFRYDADVTYANHSVGQIGVTLMPYQVFEGSITESAEHHSNKETFVSDIKFGLSSRFGFINGKMNLIATFTYPNSDKFESFVDAYEHYNNVSLDEYSDIYLTPEDPAWLEEWNEEPVEKQQNHIQHQCGFIIQIASDMTFRNIIYDDFVEADDVDDFSFDLSGIFNSYAQLPEIVVARTTFIDRYLGTTISSNFAILNKEWFKYLINYTETYRLDPTSMSDKFNFIDKMTCVIKTDNVAENISINNPGPTVLYKPIFYRTQDLQNISLRKDLTQNIGVNLADYMTKVESFKLIIGKHEFVESARNDVYVIFKVNSAILTDLYGTYHIANHDGDYISSGNWSII